MNSQGYEPMNRTRFVRWYYTRVAIAFVIATLVSLDIILLSAGTPAIAGAGMLAIVVFPIAYVGTKRILIGLSFLVTPGVKDTYNKYITGGYQRNIQTDEELATRVPTEIIYVGKNEDTADMVYTA